MNKLLMATLLASAAVAYSVGSSAQPQDYPSKAIRVVIPFAAGGPTDVMSRALAQKLSAALGQPVVADNRPGAGGNIGAEIVAKAAPDGYTLLIGTNGPLAANLTLFGKLPYDPVKDFAPVTLYTYLPNILAVHPSVPAHNIAELISLLKSKPDEYSYASGGTGTSSHFSGELFKSMTGVRMNHIPYKGDGASMVDVLGGQVPIVFCSVLAGMRHVASGKIRALGVTSAQRVPAVPDIAPIAESGLPGFDLTAWYAVMVPAGTPKEIVRKLNTTLVQIIRSPELKEKIESMGGIPVGSTPEELADLIKAEIPRWAKLVKESGAKAD